MNVILGHIARKSSAEGCTLLGVQTPLGLFHALVVESEDFALDESVNLSFKESDVFLSDISHFSSIPNRFEGAISNIQTKDFLFRVCIKSPTNSDNDKLIYALIASPNALNLDKNIAWYVPCAHIVLEKVL